MRAQQSKNHWAFLHWGALIRDIDSTVWRFYHVVKPFSTPPKSTNSDFVTSTIDGFTTDSVCISATDLVRIIKDFENEQKN